MRHRYFVTVVATENAYLLPVTLLVANDLFVGCGNDAVAQRLQVVKPNRVFNESFAPYIGEAEISR